MRVFALCLLMLMVDPAFAAWVKFGANDDSSIVMYIDPATIRKEGNLRRIWELQDLKNGDGNGGYSYRMLSEYDCKGGRVRFLSFTVFPERMAAGRSLARGDEPMEWRHIAPGEITGDVLERVCRK